MSEIIAAVYEKIEQSGMKEGILFIDEQYHATDAGKPGEPGDPAR